MDRASSSMHSPPGYIDLDRRFSVLRNSGLDEDLTASSYLSGPYTGATLGWHELLNERLAIVLGEPGSGKTYEFRQQCASLKVNGRFAFLIELERLVAGTIASGLSDTELALLREWQRGEEPAFVFLDSVDEAKIRRQSDFYSALDSVVNGIGSAIDRAHVFVSSRISEWQPETDLREVLSRFQVPRGEVASSEHEEVLFHVFQLEPLDRDRVRKFTESREISNPARFLKELDIHCAWEFVRRPLDVLALAEFWETNGRLGTLTEILEHNVTTTLRETTSRHATFPLSEKKAREGAEALAIATILCKRFQFKVPDDTYQAPEALDAARCLPADWLPAEVAAILSRPLFDSATYGQIRFHHRRVAEYLAACWFRRRMSDGCPTHVLYHLLFEEVNGAPITRRSLIPVIAWLSNGHESWNDEVRTWVLSGAPEIHLEYGDPAKLSLDYKRALLTAWIERNKGRDDIWTRYSHDTLRRLAEPQLVPDIIRFLSDAELPGAVRELLVCLVWRGRLVECIPTLVALLESAAESDDVKLYAMAALRDIGTPESHEKAWLILRDAPTLPGPMCSLACTTLYPTTIGAAELGVLLEKPCSAAASFSNLKYTLTDHLQEKLASDDASLLAVELNRLIQLPPHITISDKESRISIRFEFLLDVLPLVLTKLLSGETLTEAQCVIMGESLSLLAESRRYHSLHADQFESLDGLTHIHPAVRRYFFWRLVERLRSLKGTSFSRHQITHYFQSASLKLDQSDLEWMIEDLQKPRNGNDRKLLLSFVLTYADRRHWERLKGAVKGDSELIRMLEAYRSASRWSWLRRQYYRWCHAAEWRHWWIMRRHHMRMRWKSVRERWWIWKHRDHLRSGRAVSELAKLCLEAATDGAKHAPANWQCLSDKRGAKIAEAVKAGCMRTWQTYSPPLPHEKSRANEVPSAVIVGLAGIQSAITDHVLAFNSISDDDVRLLARYAVNEMNGFPDWFPDLATVRPRPVCDVLNACVVGEWSYTADREHAHGVLSHLDWEGQTLARLARPQVVECLRTGDPSHQEIRDAAIRLVLKTTEVPDDDVAQIAAFRCRSLCLDSTAFPVWCAVLLQLNADEAIDVLEERVLSHSGADDIVLSVCEALVGDIRRHLSLINRPDYLRIPPLERLIPLIHRHVRPAEDIDHADGEPYSRTSRDEVGTFRDGLLTRLANSDDSGATASLRRLAVRPELFQSRDWILHLTEERMLTEVDSRNWTAAEIRDFTQVKVWSKQCPDVLLVTVNRHETQAVFEAFLAATGGEAVPLPVDRRLYHDLGTLNGTRVFHAISEMGSGSVGAMQQTVDRAIRAFKPGMVIAIGIAFGIDDKKQNIGDILLSKQLRPYELQRVGRHEIVLRGPKPDASPRLINHFEVFAGTRWSGASVSSGVILTGEKLVDNLDYRTQLLKLENEAIGGEMEGAGLYASASDHQVDWIVLKAICDFADGNKGQDKEPRQQLAARNSAQFLVASLLHAPLKRDL